jgi:hypothetical protein
MTTPEQPRPAFLSLPQPQLDALPQISDRTADLGAVVVRLSLGVHLHVNAAAQARALADAFIKAGRLLTEAGKT